MVAKKKQIDKKAILDKFKWIYQRIENAEQIMEGEISIDCGTRMTFSEDGWIHREPDGTERIDFWVQLKGIK